MPPVLETCAEGLHLKLANGQEWSLVAEESLCPWLQEFGHVMGLKSRAINGLPKLVFTSRTLGVTKGTLVWDGFADDIPRTGWTSRDLEAMRVWTHPFTRDVVCEIEPDASQDIDVLRMWFVVDVLHTKAVDSGGLPLHAGLVEHNRQGVLLAGGGGVGKSTCCQRIPKPWRAPCDDAVLAVVDTAGEFRCHPFPTWSDYLWGRSAKTWNVQDHFPIKGIAFLRQAEKDHTRPVGQGEAAMLINSSARQMISGHLRGLSASESDALKRQIFENGCRLAQKVPAFILSVARDGTFWVEIEKALDL
jgi:SynChlorMet cassette protein ScmC